jgi:hypothetical protein
MSPYKILPAVAAIGALVAVDVGSAADAPSVSGQTAWAGTSSPVTVPGTGLKQHAAIPKGARLVYRNVTISPGQKVTFRFTATGGRTLRGLVPGTGRQVGFAVVKPYYYAGKTSVTVRAFAASQRGGRVPGRIYAYTR